MKMKQKTKWKILTIQPTTSLEETRIANPTKADRQRRQRILTTTDNTNNFINLGRIA